MQHLTLEDLERLEQRAAEDVSRWDVYRAQVLADPRSTTQEEAAMEACAAAAARAQVPLLAVLRSVMAERDALAARVRQLQDEALDVAECRRLANVAVDQAEAARSKLRSVTDERDGLRALCALRAAIAAIEAREPAARVACPSCGVFDAHTIGCEARRDAMQPEYVVIAEPPTGG